MYIFLLEGQFFIKGHEQSQETTKEPQELVYYTGGYKAPKKQKYIYRTNHGITKPIKTRNSY